MATIKLSELGEAFSLGSADLFYAVKDNTSYKITKANALSDYATTTSVANLTTLVGDITSLETTDKTSIVNAINELNDSLFYKDGDTLTGTFQVAGYVTSGTKDLFCMIYVPKSMAKISSITISSGTFTIRTTAGNYLNGASGGINYNASGITTTVSKNTDNAVAILMRSTNAYTSVSNNTPVSGAISGLTLTFNE